MNEVIGMLLLSICRIPWRVEFSRGKKFMLISDRPISSTADDILGFSSFADAIALSLTEMAPEEGIVLSIEGAWGTGKTSAIQLIEQRILLRELSRETEESLEKLSQKDWSSIKATWTDIIDTRRAHILRFNPWNFSGQDNLVRAFFSEVGNVIGHPSNSALSKAVRKITSYLPSVGTVVGGGGAALAGVVPAASIGATAGKAVGEGIQRFFEEAIPSLETAKREMAEALLQSKKRIFVIIDDLDRLGPSEMRAMFSLVKGLGDLPNILYVLSFDRSVVVKALKTGVEPIEEEFLEKIIQVQLKLPPPWQYEIRNLFFKRLNLIIGDAVPSDERRWHSSFFEVVAPYIQSPRDVARFANTLQVIWPNVVGDIDLTDLIILTTLQLFESEIYALVFDNIEELAGGVVFDEKAFAARFDPVNARKPVVAKAALGQLFPSLHKGWNTHSWDNTVYVKKREQRRICTKEYYRNYFLFGRDPNRVSRSDIENCLTSERPEASIGLQLQKLSDGKTIGKSLTGSFLDQIFEIVFVKPLLSGAVVEALLKFSDDLILRADLEWDFFTEDNLRRLESIIVFGLIPLSAEDRRLRVETISNSNDGLTLSALAVRRLAGHLGLYGGEKRQSDEQYISEDAAIDAASKILERIREAAKSGRLLFLPQSLSLIWTWKSFANSEEVKEWLAAQLDSRESILRLAEILPHTSYQSDSHGRREVRSFRAKTYEEIFDTEEFKTKLANLAASDPDDQHLRRVQQDFLAAEVIGRNDPF